MNREAKAQRISFLMADLQERLLDVAFLSERVDHTASAAKDYYLREKAKEESKIEKIRAELSKLGATQ